MKKSILSGFGAWHHDAQRASSPHLDFGAWWELDGRHWRVAWIQDTGELYAAELGKSDRYVILGTFATKKEVNYTMHHWFEGADLGAFLRRMDHL